MTKRIIYSFVLSFLFLIAFPGSIKAQDDTTLRPADTTLKPVVIARDTAAALVAPAVDSTWYNHSPRKATIRSAIIPGWGQAYNKQYWKIPFIYGALGTTAVVFVYNLDNYHDLRLAYSGHYKASQPVPPNSPPGTKPDSTDYFLMKPKYQKYDAESIRYYRDEFRKNIDYSVLVFLIFWGLNVADAAAAAHLRTFDVSPDLSLRIKPGRSYMGGTNGISLVLAFK